MIGSVTDAKETKQKKMIERDKKEINIQERADFKF